MPNKLGYGEQMVNNCPTGGKGTMRHQSQDAQCCRLLSQPAQLLPKAVPCLSGLPRSSETCPQACLKVGRCPGRAVSAPKVRGGVGETRRAKAAGAQCVSAGRVRACVVQPRCARREGRQSFLQAWCVVRVKGVGGQGGGVVVV